MTVAEAIESMRLAIREPPAVRCQMTAVLADVWTESGMKLEVEALRLLAEIGWMALRLDPTASLEKFICHDWWLAMFPFAKTRDFHGSVRYRLAKMDACVGVDVDADAATRERWAVETRAMAANGGESA